MPGADMERRGLEAYGIGIIIDNRDPEKRESELFESTKNTVVGNEANMFYGNEEEMDSEFPIDYERDGYEESDQNIIEIEDNKYSFDKDTIRSCLQSPLEEYFSGLLRLNYGKGRVTDALEEDSFKCDLAKLKEDLMSYNPEFRGFLDAQNFLYADSTPNDKKYTYGERYVDAMKYLHRTICLHPLEFSKRTREDPKNHATGVVDIRSDIDIDGFIDSLGGNNKFYSVYPPLFYRIMEESGLLEFNPYESCISITPRYYKEQGKIELIDTPGFTTYSTATDNDKFPELLRIEDKYYASINVGFNVHTTQRYDVHMGVDFPGQLNDEYKKVVALIHGKVWACTWNGSINEASSGYGRVMIIKGDNNLLYLLAHLSTFLKKVGDEVFPGEDVAIAGNTGNSSGAHLHLEVHRTNILGFDMKFVENILDLKGNHNQKEPDGDNGLLWQKGYDFKSARVNPFDHNEKFNGS